MKILIVFKESVTDNLFVHTLYNQIKKQGISIECSLDRFWDSNSHYDIIHFQWPEEVIGWNCTDVTQINKLKERIAYFKQRGSKFVYTRHNTCPHYSNSVISEAYKVIESNCSVIVHMGQYSYDEFKTKYPDSENRIIEHHIYENTYNEKLSEKEARMKLKIPYSKFVITTFGKYRNAEERMMVIKAFLKLKIKNKYLLAPRFFPFSKAPLHACFIKRCISQLAYYTVIPLCRLFNLEGGAMDKIIDHEDLPYYLSSSDIVLIQRKQILNSGNIPLAFMFKKTVIGPRTGNVGDLLEKTGNPTFDPNDTNSIISAIEVAQRLHNQGERNYEFASEYMNLQRITGQYIATYKSLLP